MASEGTHLQVHNLAHLEHCGASAACNSSHAGGQSSLSQERRQLIERLLAERQVMDGISAMTT